MQLHVYIKFSVTSTNNYTAHNSYACVRKESCTVQQLLQQGVTFAATGTKEVTLA